MLIQFQNPDGSTSSTEITLPQGLGAEGINTIPSAYIQASVGLFKGTAIKIRYLPEINIEEVSSTAYGAAIQHGITSWIPGHKLLSVRLSALIGYTAFKGSYDFESSALIQGNNQRLETHIDSWLFSAIASTKLPVINFYAGIGYVTGKATTDLKGEYTVKEGVIAGKTLTNPFSITNQTSGLKGTVGFKLSLGVFNLHADYNFQKINAISAGVGVAI